MIEFNTTAVVKFNRGKGDRELLKEFLEKIPEDAAIQVMSTGVITATWSRTGEDD
jgi:hypothetical protein